MTLVLSTESILKKIEKQRYKHAKVFEGFVVPNDADNKHHFEKFDCDTPEQLINEIQEFSELYHGKFTILMRVHHGGTDKTLSACRWSTIPEAKPVEQGNTVSSEKLMTIADLEAQKKIWLQELSTTFKLKEYESIIQMKDAELNGFKANGDKLAYVALQVLSGMSIGKKLGISNLNGTGTENIKQPESVPVQNAEELKAALNKLHWLLGEEILIKLAKKINPGDEMIGMVKMYANS